MAQSVEGLSRMYKAPDLILRTTEPGVLGGRLESQRWEGEGREIRSSRSSLLRKGGRVREIGLAQFQPQEEHRLQ